MVLSSGRAEAKICERIFGERLRLWLENLCGKRGEYLDVEYQLGKGQSVWVSTQIRRHTARAESSPSLSISNFFSVQKSISSNFEDGRNLK